MSSEQRWMINDALGLLLQLSRACCLAPVRFVKIRTNTFTYISRPLLLLSVIITSILHLYTIYHLYIAICNTERGNYNEMFLIAFNISVIIIIVSYAVLHSGTRVKNYMTCLTKLKRAIRDLQSTEEIPIKKCHMWILFIILIGGINLAGIYHTFVFSGSIDSLTCVLILEITLTVVIQQQILYFALYVGVVFKIIKEKFQEELSKLYDKNGKQLGNLTTSRINIPLASINKAIDMIGMAEQLFPDLLTTEKQNIAHRIGQIHESYIVACEVLRELSNSDDFLLFLLLIYFSFCIVYFSYGIIKLFHQGSLLSAKLIDQCLLLLVHAIRVMMVVEPCYVVHEEILKIRFVLCEIMCHVTSTSDPVFRVIDGFFHELVLNDISYTAMGIYKIGRPLVASIIAVVSTILNTILQF